MVIMDNLITCIKAHEGLKLFPYLDTEKKWTIGFGRNLSDCGISNDEALMLLEDDIKKCEIELSHFLWFTHLDTVRQEVLIELNFNIGLMSLLKFIQMINSIQAKDYDAAAMHLLNSKWAQQVGPTRANNMAERLKTGQYAG